MTKLNILCLWAAEPREPASGTPVDIARLLDEGNPLRPIFDDPALALAGTIANRVIAASGPASTLRAELAKASPEVAESHLLDNEARGQLAEPAPAAFLQRRAGTLTAAFERHVDRMAEWGARDGRSIADLLRTG